MSTPDARALRVALIGMGRMGRAIAALARERAIDVVATLGPGEAITRQSLADADVAIEFAEPD
ncbi:MAG: hypothetical protein ACXW61_10370, partial [Gemmatirosa sp.]